MPTSDNDLLASIIGDTNNASVSQDDPNKPIVNKPIKNPVDADAYLASLINGPSSDSNTNTQKPTETLAQHQARMKLILERNAQISKDEQDNSGLGKQFGLAVLQGATKPLTDVFGTLTKMQGAVANSPLEHNVNLGLQSIKNGIDNALAKVQPTVNPQSPIASTIAQGLGGSLGELGAQVATFKGAGPIVGAIGEGLESLPLAQKALSAISEIAGTAGNWAESKLPNLVGKGLDGIINNAPSNIAQAGIATGLQNPESLTTPKGIGMTMGMGMIGAAGDAGFGLGGFKPQQNSVDVASYSADLNKALDDPQGNAASQGKDKTGQVLPDYSKKIQSQLGDRRSTSSIPTLTETLGKVADLGSSIRARIFNKNQYIDDAQSNSSSIPDRNSPSALATLTAGSGGRIDQTLNNGPFTFDAATGLPKPSGVSGLAQILQDVNPRDLGTLDRVLTASHSLSKDDGTGDLSAERQEMRNADPSLISKAQQILQYNTAVHNYPVAAGVATPELAPALDKIYSTGIDLSKLFTSSEAGQSLYKKATTAGKYGLDQLQGSLESKQHSPIANSIDMTKRIIAGTDRARVWSALADMADAEPGKFNDIMRPAEDGAFADQYNSKLLMKWASDLQDATLDPSIKNDPTKMAESLSKQDAMNLVNLLHPVYEKGSGIVNVSRPEGMSRYKISPELARYAEAMSPQEVGGFTQFMQGAAGLAKAGITKDPSFMLFHGLIDNITAKTQSQYGYQFGADWLRGLAEGYRKGNSYNEWQQMGGGGGTLGDGAKLTDPYGVNSIIPKTGPQKAITTILHPLDALGKLTQPIYTAAKLGEYMNIRNNHPNVDPQIAVLASRNVTPDMMQIGGNMRFLSGISEFTNPALQHIDNLYQNIKNNPTGVFAKGAALITLPSIANWYANQNDEAINQIRKSPSGDKYWYVRIHEGDDGIAKVKKPYLLGHLFGTLPEEALDAMVGNDPNTVNQAGMALKDAFRVNFIPQTAQTAMGLWANKQWFNDAPIVPQVQQGIDPQFQSTNTTSQLAKSVSNTLYNMSGGNVNLSPIQLDFVLNHQFGSLGEDIGKGSNFVSKSDNTGPARGIADIPVIGKFIAKYPTRNQADINQFYDMVSKADEVGKTVKSLYETQNPSFSKYIEKNQAILGVLPTITEAKAQISKINGELYQINSSPDAMISPDEKKMINDQYIKEILMITQMTNKSIQQSGLVKP